MNWPARSLAARRHARALSPSTAPAGSASAMSDGAVEIGGRLTTWVSRPRAVPDERAVEMLERIAAVSARPGGVADGLAEVAVAIAQVVGARRVAFWRLREDGSLTIEPRAFGFSPDELAALIDPVRDDVRAPRGMQVAVSGEVVRGRVASDATPLAGRVAVSDTLAVPWRLGIRILGALTLFDALDGGFDDADIAVAQVAALGSGLVLQQRETTPDRTHALEEHAERLAALERTKSDFLNLASHELRGPLGVARGYVSMISEGSLGGVSPRVSEVLPVVSSKLTEISNLVDQMLETARLDDNRLDLNVERVDLSRLCMEAVASLRPQMDASIPRISILATAPLEVTGDRRRLLTVLANLISNAIKYSPATTPIDVTANADEGLAMVRVADRGFGIAVADRRRLFSRFGRIVTSDTCNIPGTGLGLFLCRQIAMRHGGDVIYSPRHGGGSMFSLHLPLRAVSSQPPASL